MTIKRNRSITIPTPDFVAMNTDHVESFITHKKNSAKKITPATERAYRAYIPSFLEMMNGHALIAARDTTALEDAALQWLSIPLGKKTMVSDATWNRRRAYLKAFFAFLVKRKVLPENPLSDSEKRTEEPRELFFGDADVKRCADFLYKKYIAKPKFLNLRNYLLFIFLSMTGARAGEAGGFSRCDIDPALEMVKIKGKITKTKHTRHVPIPYYSANTWMKKKKKTDYQILFEAYYTAHEKAYPDASTPFFCSQTGEKMTSSAIRQAILPAMRECGLQEARIHDLRHYALTSMAMNGGVAAVQHIAGHATPVMTARYVNPTPQQICAIAAATWANTATLLPTR